MTAGEYYTIEGVAKHFGVHEQTVRGWLRKGVLSGFKAGRDWRFTDQDIKSCEDNLREETGKHKKVSLTDEEDSEEHAEDRVAVV